MEDQICSPEKYSTKKTYNKNIFYLNEYIYIYIYIYYKNVSY